MTKLVGIVLGTRPEIIKMAPVIRECEARGIEYQIIHSNQHYDKNLDEIFFRDLKLRPPDYNLGIGSASPGKQTGAIMQKLDEILTNNRPSVVLVEGDTNTVLAGAVTASKLGIPVGHVEAGLRSFFRGMPEEINRILTDHCADALYAPTERSKGYLKAEGLPEDRIVVTGNTVVDALLQHREIAVDRSRILDDLNLIPREYCVLTMHRAENVDIKERVLGVMDGLSRIARQDDRKFVFPIHPRTLKRFHEQSIEIPKNVLVVEPVGYLDFITLMDNAKVIMTDSGGIQEESCVLGVPCITLRDNTERPETIEVGSNELSGVVPESIEQCYFRAIEKEGNWKNPYGTGDSASRILDHVETCFL